MNSVSLSQNKDSSKYADNVKIKSSNANTLNSVYKMKMHNKLTEPRKTLSSSTKDKENKKFDDKTLGLLQKLVKKDFGNEIKEKIILVLNQKDIKKTELKVFL